MDTKKTLLISTSYVNDMRMLDALLSAQGFEIITALDIKSLSTHFKKRLPDIVLVDYELAGADAADVCRLIKSESYNKSVQVIGIAPLMNTHAHSVMLKSGADDIIFRPFSSDEIVIRLNAASERQMLAEESVHLEKLLFSLASAFEARDENNIGHPERVARMSRRFAERLGLSKEDQEALFKGGMLHDIGMIKIPKGITDKPSALTNEEYELLKMHTVWGERMCRPVRSLAPILPILRHHHEQIDGKGYPDGLSGTDIPELARILAVSEVFDALCSDRTYRNRLKQEDALRYLNEYAQRKWLDAGMVKEFIEMIKEEGWPDVPKVDRSEKDLSAGNSKS